MVKYGKLIKKFKTAWIKALRSGKYKQAQNSLYVKGEGYCCLGVAASLFKLRGNEKILSDSAHLSDQAGEKIGLTQEAQNKLIYLNDTKNENFNQIADWIEKHL